MSNIAVSTAVTFRVVKWKSLNGQQPPHSGRGGMVEWLKLFPSRESKLTLLE